MAISSLRILVRFDFPTGTVRLWDGSGPYIDAAGDVWRGTGITDGLDVIEQALNGEVFSFDMGVSGLDPSVANLAWADYQAGDVIGSAMQILLQSCDKYDQPVGTPRVRFTGRVDNIRFSDVAADSGIVSSVVITCINRFALRRTTAGSVLSDIDQKARAAVINPEADPDRFCERVSLLIDKTIDWPRFN